MKKLLLLLALLIAAQASAATYYIDFATGSNANNGTAKATPWKYAPGMTSFAGSYTHAAGDQFIFKGGVTWPDPASAGWTLAGSGSAGNNDYYGVDKSWYTGGAWTQPIFDGGSNPAVVNNSNYWNFLGRNYITLDNLRLQNIGVTGVNRGNRAINMTASHDLLVENMTLSVMSRIAILVGPTATGTFRNYEFKNNDISNCAWGIAGGAVNTGTVFSNVYIHDNHFHDFNTQVVSGTHGDGIYFYSTSTYDPTSYMDQVYIYNNLFDGVFTSASASMTAFIWVGYQMNGSAYIFNNVFGYTPGPSGYEISAEIAAGQVGSGNPPYGTATSGSVYVYNNSGHSDPNSNYWINGSTLANLVVENNIYQGGIAGYVLGYYGIISNITSDYNNFYGWSNTGNFAFFLSYSGFKSTGPITAISVYSGAGGTGYNTGDIISANYGVGNWSTVTATSGVVTGLALGSGGLGNVGRTNWGTGKWTGSGTGLKVNTTVAASSGFESHGKNSNPLFSLSTPNDLTLQTGSPSIGSGLNLYSVCNGQPNPGLGALCFDINGVARSATYPWDMGAYANSAPPTPASVNVSPLVLSFVGSDGNGQIVGTTSAAQIITAYNPSTATLTFTSIVLAGASFSISSNTCGGTLAGGASCTVSVTFNPSPAGFPSYSGTVTFTDNAADSPQVVTLSGTGSAPLTLGSGTWGSGTIN